MPAMSTHTLDAYEEAMEPGTRVEVRSEFDRQWKRGFEVVAEDTDGRLILKRLSDGAHLPVAFDPDVVRKERRHRQNWWY